MRVSIAVPDDWSERQAIMLAERLQASELPEECDVAVFSSSGGEGENLLWRNGEAVDGG